LKFVRRTISPFGLYVPKIQGAKIQKVPPLRERDKKKGRFMLRRFLSSRRKFVWLIKNNKLTVIAALVGLLHFSASSPAQATPLTWTIDAIFLTDGIEANFQSDGGKLIGSFVYDADANQFSNWQITTSGGNIPGFSYNPFTAQPISQSAHGFVLQTPTFAQNSSLNVGQWTLSIQFVDNLTNDGGQTFTNADGILGLSNLDSLAYETFADAIDTSAAEVSRFRLAGSVVAAVPEPETYAMMLAGLGLLGFTARRRKQNLVV
jgi:hypothetical protein